MTVTLPTSPGFSNVKPYLIDPGGIERSALGGASQRINRMGWRFGMDCALPPLESPLAEKWVAQLNAGQSQGVIFNVSQPNIVVVPANLRIRVASAGTVLSVENAAPGYLIRSGQFISFVVSGKIYCCQVFDDVTFPSSGQAVVGLVTPLRVLVSVATPLEIVAPKIEAWLVDDRSWDIDKARLYGVSFKVKEK